MVSPCGPSLLLLAAAVVAFSGPAIATPQSHHGNKNEHNHDRPSFKRQHSLKRRRMNPAAAEHENFRRDTGDAMQLQQPGELDDLSLHATSTTTENCIKILAMSDWNRNRYLDSTEYIQFLNRMDSQKPTVYTAFEELPVPLQDAYNELTVEGLLGIDIAGSMPNVNLNATAAQEIHLNLVCQMTQTAIDELHSNDQAVPTAAPQSGPDVPYDDCVRFLLNSDSNGNEELTSTEYMRFVNLAASLEWITISAFDELPRLVQENFHALASLSGNLTTIDIAGARSLPPTDLQTKHLELVCEQTQLAISAVLGASRPSEPSAGPPQLPPFVTQQPWKPDGDLQTSEPTSEPPPPDNSNGLWNRITVFNAYILTNTAGLASTGLMLEANSNRKALDQGYEAFVRAHVNLFRQGARRSVQRHTPTVRRRVQQEYGSARLRNVTFIRDSSETYLIQDIPCPFLMQDAYAESAPETNRLQSPIYNCQMVYSMFAVQAMVEASSQDSLAALLNQTLYQLTDQTQAAIQPESDTTISSLATTAPADGSLQSYVLDADPNVDIQVYQSSTPVQPPPSGGGGGGGGGDGDNGPPPPTASPSSQTNASAGGGPIEGPISTGDTTDPPAASSPHQGGGMVAGVVIGVLLLLVFLMAMWCWNRRRHRHGRGSGDLMSPKSLSRLWGIGTSNRRKSDEDAVAKPPALTASSPSTSNFDDVSHSGDLTTTKLDSPAGSPEKKASGGISVAAPQGIDGDDKDGRMEMGLLQQNDAALLPPAAATTMHQELETKKSLDSMPDLSSHSSASSSYTPNLNRDDDISTPGELGHVIQSTRTKDAGAANAFENDSLSGVNLRQDCFHEPTSADEHLQDYRFADSSSSSCKDNDSASSDCSSYNTNASGHSRLSAEGWKETHDQHNSEPRLLSPLETERRMKSPIRAKPTMRSCTTTATWGDSAWRQSWDDQENIDEVDDDYDDCYSSGSHSHQSRNSPTNGDGSRSRDKRRGHAQAPSNGQLHSAQGVNYGKSSYGDHQSPSDSSSRSDTNSSGSRNPLRLNAMLEQRGWRTDSDHKRGTKSSYSVTSGSAGSYDSASHPSLQESEGLSYSEEGSYYSGGMHDSYNTHSTRTRDSYQREDRPYNEDYSQSSHTSRSSSSSDGYSYVSEVSPATKELQKQEIAELVEAVMPGKQNSVHAILQRFAGREEELITVLHNMKLREESSSSLFSQSQSPTPSPKPKRDARAAVHKSGNRSASLASASSRNGRITNSQRHSSSFRARSRSRSSNRGTAAVAAANRIRTSQTNR